MADVLLFHHIQGLTGGVEAFADTLRSAGHHVTTPELLDGKTFDTIDAGAEYVESIGFGAIIERGVAAAAECGDQAVFAGISLGVLPAQKLSQTRPTAGAVFLEACVPTSEFGHRWPSGVPVQIHGMDGDPFFAGEGDIDAAREIIEQAAATASAQLFIYPGDVHLFTDRSLDSYDAAATDLVLDRMLQFLASL